MAAISIAELESIRKQLSMLEQCVYDIETVTSLNYAGQDIAIEAGSITTAKSDTNALLATFKTDIAALMDIV